MTHPWERAGERVRVAPVAEADLPALRLAAERSRDRLAVWGPVEPDRIDRLIDRQGADGWTFLVHALDPAGPPGLAARIDLDHPVGGRLSAATLGYEAFDPYAGRGLTREGLALLLDIAFADQPGGLGLHRVEAGVQPANLRSAGLLRSLGFRLEGHSPRLVRVPTLGDAADGWRDHDRFALTVEQWPATAYAAPTRARTACLVNGVPGSGKSTLARRLANELGLPLYRKDAIKEAVADALPAELRAGLAGGQSPLGAGASRAMWALLAESPVGGVVESWFWPHDAGHVWAGLAAAGLDPAAVTEVWCQAPVERARARYTARIAAGERHAIHGADPGDDWWERVAAAPPLGRGPVLRVDTSRPVTDAEVCRLALAVRAGSRYSPPSTG